MGGNLEDARPGGLFGIVAAVDRLAAARAAAPSGSFVLNARTDTYFAGTTGDAFSETVERAVRYVDAGADCVFVPGVVEEATIRRLAAAIPCPLNVVAGLANIIDAPTLFSLGVKRVSMGGSLARAALQHVGPRRRELLDSGTLGFLDGAMAYADLQRRFGSCSRPLRPDRTGRAVMRRLAAGGVRARPLGRANWPAAAAEALVGGRLAGRGDRVCSWDGRSREACAAVP